MRPAPTTPSVLRQSRLPRNSDGSQPVKRPSRTKRSASATRRAAAKVSATASSAVVSVRMPGVLPTAIPRAVAAGDVDVVVADGVVAQHPPAGAVQRRQQLPVPALGELGDHAVAARLHAPRRSRRRSAAGCCRTRRPGSRRRRASRASARLAAAWSPPRGAGRGVVDLAGRAAHCRPPGVGESRGPHRSRQRHSVRRRGAAPRRRGARSAGAGGPAPPPAPRGVRSSVDAAYLPSSASIFLTPSAASSA